jgi:magnesium transporter
MYYLLNESLKPVEEVRSDCGPYMVIISSEELRKRSSSFGFDVDIRNIVSNLGRLTKVVFSTDSLSGTFLVPDNLNQEHHFGFVLDRNRIVFVDDNGFVKTIVEKMSKKKNLFPTTSAEFFYDFVDELSEDDIEFFGKIEKELDAMEIELVNKRRASSIRIAEIRSIIRKYMIYYEQLENVLSEMIENENDMFDEELIQDLTVYLDRIKRLYDFASDIREYSQEIRELRKEMIDMRQNNINTVIGVVTSIFLPLNLIAGWYGMNFKYMPELQWKYSYYVVILVSITIVILLLLFFKKKRWL